MKQEVKRAAGLVSAPSAPERLRLSVLTVRFIPHKLNNVNRQRQDVTFIHVSSRRKAEPRYPLTPPIDGVN